MNSFDTYFNKNIKRFFIFAVKATIAAGLLLWLAKQGRLTLAQFSKMSFDLGNVLLVCVAGLSVFLGLMLLGCRLWLILHFKGFSITYNRVLVLTLVGSFSNVVLPGLIGGDALKAGYLYLNVAERRVDALFSVIIDRVVGLYSLFLLGSILPLYAWNSDSSLLVQPIIFVALPVVLISTLVTFLISSDTFFDCRPIQLLCSRLPEQICDFLNSFRVYLSSPKLILMTIILSLVNHTLVILSFVTAGILLVDSLPIYAHLALDPLAMVMNMIPITPGGLGVTEGAFSFLFQAFGSPNGAIIGLFGRLIQYSVFSFAGIVALFSLKLKSTIHVADEKAPYPKSLESSLFKKV